MADPKVEGVTCHVSRFERGTIDRLTKGNWFEAPSNASIACRRTGPITVRGIERGPAGEEVSSQRLSLVFKALGLRRIFDEAHQTLLVHIVHGWQVTEGPAKMGTRAVALRGQQVSCAECTVEPRRPRAAL